MQNPQLSKGTTASLASQNRSDATNGSISANPNDPSSLSVSNALQPPTSSGAEACTLQALLDQVQSVQGRVRANKKRRLDAIFDHVVRFARNVDRFSKAIDIYVQGSTHGAAFVWGSLRILLRVILDHANILEKIAMTLNYFSENLERFERIKEVFAASKPLQESIGKLYHDITQFATQTAIFYSRSRLKIFVTNLWGNSRFEFDAAIANFQRHNDLVRDQALLAYFELDRQRAADIEQRRNAKSVKMLQNWLSTGSVSTLTSLHNHRLQELHPGTCKWLTPPLKTWLSAPDTPCFWIEGPPGCGKSFLLSFAANHVAQGISTDKSRATVVFCSGEESLQPGLNLIRQLLLGLLHFCSDNEEVLKHISIVRHVLEGSWSAQHETNLLWETFNSILGTLTNTAIIIVIDALDNFNQEDKERFVGNLLSLPSRSPSLSRNVRMLVASRATHGIGHHQDGKSIRLLDIEESQVKRDIDLYIRNSLRELPKLSELSLQSMDDLAAEVQDSSCGIFLWAKYTIRDIEEGIISQKTPHQNLRIPIGMKDVLRDLTACLNFGKPGYLIASIIVASEDSLGPQDIRSMFEIASWSDTLLLRIGPHVPVEKYIQDTCGPLVTCRDGAVRFYHPAVRDYLLSTQKLSLETCHAILAAACLKYASLEQFHPNHDAETGSAHDRFQTFCNAQPFLKYAVKYWSYHFLRGTRNQKGGYGEIAVQRLKEADGIAWMESSFAASDSRDSGSEDYKGRNMEIRTAFKGDSDPETIASIIEVALDAQGRGNVVKSQLLFEQVGATSVFKGLSFTIRYQVLSGLSRSYERQNRWQDAEKQYRRCLDDCRSAGPRAGVYNIQTQNSLAWVLKVQGRLSEAVEQLENAYADGRELLEPEHYESRLTADELSRTYESVGRTHEAKTVLLSQLYGCQRTLGSTHSNTIEKAQSVMNFYSRQGQTKEAETLFRKLFAESEIEGTPNVSIGQILSQLLEDRGDLDEAETILASIMRAHFEQSRPIDFGAAMRISSAFAKFHMRREAWTAALGVLKRCIDRTDHLAREGVGNRLGLLVARCKEELGQIEEAQAEYERLFSSEVEESGWTGRTSMEIGHDFAAFYERHSHWDKALEKYLQVQGSISHALGPAHRYTVDAGKTLAAFHERRKDWHEAGRLYDNIQQHLMVTRGGKHRSAKETWTSNQITRLHRIEI